MITAEIHPGPNAGNGLLEPRRTTYKPGDSEVELRRCAQCGFFNRVGIEVIGDSIDSPGISIDANYIEELDVSKDVTYLYVTNPLFSGLSYVSNLYGILICPGWVAQAFGTGPFLDTYAEPGPLDGGPQDSVFIGTLDPSKVDTFVLSQTVSSVLTGFSGNAFKFSFVVTVDSGAAVTVNSNTGVLVSQSSEFLDTQGFYSFYRVSAIYRFTANPSSLNIQLALPTSGVIIMTPNIFKTGKIIANPTTISGCRFCGSLNSPGKNRNWRDYGTGVDMSNK